MLLAMGAPQLTQADLNVTTLGEAAFTSPLGLSTDPDDDIADFVPDEARVLLEVETTATAALAPPLLFEKAGPRAKSFFDPARSRAGIVTCGGLSPGLNNVVRSMVLELYFKYGVKEILGYRYGFEGLNSKIGMQPMMLGPDEVRTVHTSGGSFLGLSRGKQDIKAMVDTLQRDRVDMLFVVGGDGSLRGALALHQEITRRGARIAILGVPKTIDNDVAYVDKTFGFDTAVEIARLAIDGAHAEAVSARNGVAVVKLMGRESGFVAAAATTASAEVNFCLVPEVRFELEGPDGLLMALQKRLNQRGHAVIVVAEGCGASLVAPDAERDASGNVRYSSADADIGPRLRDAIVSHFKRVELPITVKYIDPSYMIRSVPANASDSIFCDALARQAVHAAMAGKTGIAIGRWHGVFTHVPLPVTTSYRKRIDPDRTTWLAVTETTGQPRLFGGRRTMRP
jgi:6-phosphofructokinase 1